MENHLHPLFPVSSFAVCSYNILSSAHQRNNFITLPTSMTPPATGPLSITRVYWGGIGSLAIIKPLVSWVIGHWSLGHWVIGSLGHWVITGSLGHWVIGYAINL